MKAKWEFMCTQREEVMFETTDTRMRPKLHENISACTARGGDGAKVRTGSNPESLYRHYNYGIMHFETAGLKRNRRRRKAMRKEGDVMST
jgi:hypothetical protein